MITAHLQLLKAKLQGCLKRYNRFLQNNAGNPSFDFGWNRTAKSRNARHIANFNQSAPSCGKINFISLLLPNTDRMPGRLMNNHCDGIIWNKFDKSAFLLLPQGSFLFAQLAPKNDAEFSKIDDTKMRPQQSQLVKLLREKAKGLTFKRKFPVFQTNEKCL